MAKTQRTTTVTYKGTAITDITDASMSEQSAGATPLLTDAAESPQAIHVDGINYSGSVTTTDLTQKTTLITGDVGALVITRKDRANGRGDAAGVQVETYPDAVFMGYSDSAATTGAATLTLNFETTSPDGTVASQRVYS